MGLIEPGQTTFICVFLPANCASRFTAARRVIKFPFMAAEFDGSDFVDTDFQSSQKAGQPAPGAANRPPTREELDASLSNAQQRINQLKREQEEVERQRAQMEEIRRRKIEFQTGREELTLHLTRGVALLEEAEFTTRREAEQMASSLGELREAMTKVQTLNDEHWTKENENIELTRALTTIENARMEWNSARLKFPFLSGENTTATPQAETAGAPESFEQNLLRERSYAELCKMGLALTWPVAVVGVVIVLVLLMRN